MARTTARVRLPTAPGQPRPFTGGKVTDRPPWELRAHESPGPIVDVIWPNGVPCERGQWVLQPALGTALLNVDGAVAVYDSVTGSTTFEMSAGPYVTRFGNSANVSSVNVGANPYLPRAQFNDERLFADAAGAAPVRRYAGATAQERNLTGTIAWTQGSRVIVGTGTAFLTEAAVNQYVWVDGYVGGVYRVVSVTSNTELSVDMPVELPSKSGLTAALLNFGQLGLLSEVTRAGSVTNATRAVTGKGTLFRTSPADVAQADVIGKQAAETELRTISGTPASNTSLTISSGSSAPSWTDAAYIIGRQAAAFDVCVHRGRLWFAGGAFARRRLSSTPPAPNLGTIKNGQDSPDVNAMEAALLDSVDIPSPGAEGRLVALLSGGDPGPLLILTTTDLYRGDGDGGASDLTYTRVDGLGAEAGCVDVRSAVRGADGLFWAGPEGIYRWAGGNVLDLTADRIKREWQALMRNRTSSARVICLNVDSHLIVWFEDLANTSVCYACHLPTGGWTQFSNMRAKAAFLYRKPGSRDVGYFIPNGTPRQVASLDGVLRDDPGRVAAAPTDPDVPAFTAQTPPTLTGDEQDVERVLEASVSYELTGSGNTGLQVSSAVDGQAVGQDGLLDAGNPGELLVRTLRPDPGSASAGGLGRVGQQFAMRFTRTGQPASRMRLHEVVITLRKRRQRARPE